MTIKRISFPTDWLDEDGDRRYAKAEFKLGEGPCRRWVSKLSYVLTDETLTIRQAHTIGGPKDFIYRTRDINGRIEVEYE